MHIQGAMTALITPFNEYGIDDNALKHLIQFQIQNGIDGLIICGTTGEASTLTAMERYHLMRLAIMIADKKVPIIIGTGHNCTYTTIQLTEQAKDVGADAALIVTPYYNKPSQAGLYAHYKTIAQKVDFPIILYNVPSRTGVNLTIQTVKDLAEIPNIIGIKEASGDLDQMRDIIDNTADDFFVFSGDDAMNHLCYLHGGNGCISVTGNILPKDISKMWDAAALDDEEEVLAISNKLEELNTAMFMDTNPVPVKTALALMNYCKLHFRLPLVSMNDKQTNNLKNIISSYKLI